MPALTRLRGQRNPAGYKSHEPWKTMSPITCFCICLKFCFFVSLFLLLLALLDFAVFDPPEFEWFVKTHTRNTCPTTPMFSIVSRGIARNRQLLSAVYSRDPYIHCLGAVVQFCKKPSTTWIEILKQLRFLICTRCTMTYMLLQTLLRFETQPALKRTHKRHHCSWHLQPSGSQVWNLKWGMLDWDGLEMLQRGFNQPTKSRCLLWYRDTNVYTKNYGYVLYLYKNILITIVKFQFKQLLHSFHSFRPPPSTPPTICLWPATNGRRAKAEIVHSAATFSSIAWAFEKVGEFHCPWGFLSRFT